MKMRKGFTLIELMIVIAIIAIIAAIAIPNLMQSRIRANEATAVTALKNFCTGQVTFQVGKQGRVTSNGGVAGSTNSYCVTWPNMFYGNPVMTDTTVDAGSNLALISKAHADAWVTTKGTNGTPTTVAATASPYQGYQFETPKEAVADTQFFVSGFSQIGVPARSGSTGNNAYWVGLEGTVYSKGLAKNTLPSASVTETTPLATGGYSGWVSL